MPCPQKKPWSATGIKTDAAGFEPATSGLEGVLETYFSYLKLSGIGTSWYERCCKVVKDFIEGVNNDVNEKNTLKYLKALKEHYNDVETYRKDFFQIRKFLQFMDMPYANRLQAPKARNKNNIQIWRCSDIKGAYERLRRDTWKYTRRYTACLLLGATSGLRASELYALAPEDIDLERRIVYVRKSKTGHQRIAFFNQEAQEELQMFLQEFKDNDSDVLFYFHRTQKVFSKLNIRVKDLRKFFSQEWDRQGGATSIKKILMGHSLNGDVDLNHYNVQSEEDLKKIYDQVGLRICSNTIK